MLTMFGFVDNKLKQHVHRTTTTLCNMKVRTIEAREMFEPCWCQSIRSPAFSVLQVAVN